MPRTTRVRAHSRSNAAFVKEHTRKLSPKDVRDILTQRTEWWDRQQMESLTERLQDMCDDNDDLTPEQLDKKILAVVTDNMQNGLPVAQASDVTNQFRAYVRDRTTDADLDSALRVLDSQEGKDRDRAYDNAYDVLCMKHSFVTAKHRKAMSNAMNDMFGEEES